MESKRGLTLISADFRAQPGPVADEEVWMGLKRWVPEYEPARH